MIKVQNLSKKYGDRVAVDDLSFTLSKGSVHGLLGPNGAGKSTTMNMITGCLDADSGSILIDGIDISTSPLEAKKKIGYLPEIPPLYDNMTPYEYLVFVAEAKKVPYEKLYKNVKSVIELTDLEREQDRLIKNLSKGCRQRVGIAQAMLGNPDIIVLDEPTVGLDPKQIIAIRALIKKLGKLKTLIVSSHILSEIGEVCDDLLIMSQGRLIAHDTPQNLEARLGSTSALKLSVRGDKEKIFSAIENIEGLGDCTVTDTGDGIVSLKLEYDPRIEIRDLVFSALAAARCPILSMDTESLTLEDIYLKLTDSQKSAQREAVSEKKRYSRKRGKTK